MFELKKVMSALLMPLPALLLIGLLGLALISFTTKRKTGCFVVLFSFVGLFLVAFQPVSTKLLMPLEREHKAFLPVAGTIDYVMVLGNGHVVDDEIPPTSQLNRAALMRLTEGIRILRMYPGAKLILSGYDGGSEISHARMMANVALALGVAKSDIILLEDAKDTWEEARQAAAFVQQKEIVLVTSASHMSRALYEFNAAGIKPIPAPTNFLAIDEVSQPWDKYSPKARYLEQTELFWHEYLGSVWQRLRDTVGQTPMVEAE
ncbi:envelope biogenesis factor ElyC [Vibrio parahaemolyticus]|uniref:envelope biogenesis factor ElyC n=1 Tax=Vibrio parahaemolyticus TaxID=670 RepID=UPI0003F836F6|nr:envelope biogenesis factor ElyC [Vibrio parahaemolyticus]EGR1749506.1 envelope biogenesis factor ElyC [Vibrio parahaemolyticus]EHH1238658.1 envelope biogenesis factor ElyC [Vibrio parahaemolyticus]EHJ9991947.1 envelope biogenesis factor ElyC [Vibrio parahaemolyticus]EKA7381429.1 envelope biogenesis factor ElyC [Vibrio parahaemolyticus]EME0902287.1 envelope biogenesis factor ElyC [Vibrio parahaemolyticus]